MGIYFLRYPGLIAPASLKHYPMGLFQSPLISLSGVNRPGLIEAVIVGTFLARAHMLSGVNRPGLIEAGDDPPSYER